MKDLRLAASVAFSQMRTRQKQSIIATAGVVFGVTVFIFLLAYVKGLNGYVQETTLEQTPHVRLYNEPEIARHTILDKISPNIQNYTHHVKPKAVLPNIKDGLQVIQEIRQDSRFRRFRVRSNRRCFTKSGCPCSTGRLPGLITMMKISCSIWRPN